MSTTTRTDALHENQQRVAKDLTNRDLKLTPPAELEGAERTKWLGAKPDTVTTEVAGKSVTLTGEALTRWKYQRYMQDYLATVQSVDDGVGRLLETLDREGLAKNTIVIYTSDQGFFLGDHGMFDKRFMYEESLRMPFLVRWPAAIKPGTRADAIGLNVDFAPTFLDAAGLPANAEMQGTSLLPVLRGRTPKDWRTSMYYRYYHDPGDHNTRAHLRRPHAHAQADPLLEEGSVGAVRPRQGSHRDATICTVSLDSRRSPPRSRPNYSVSSGR